VSGVHLFGFGHQRGLHIFVHVAEMPSNLG
jgi:hypothetical protein